jgi:ABC-type multidrug transport system fused ATPase/permease subunit
MFTFLFAKTQLFFFACTPPHKSFFGLPSWWKYLGGKNDALGNCVPNVNLIGHPSNLWLIGLAILDSLLRIAGFVAVISIMVAGIELIRSEGSPEKATNARQRLLNSLVGLAIAGGATALVTFVGNTAGGSTNASGLPHASANQATINNVLNALFVIVGALAVLFIILAGLRMVVSGDNPTKVAEARRQILFAALGLILLALAGIIVNFVLKKLG